MITRVDGLVENQIEQSTIPLNQISAGVIEEIFREIKGKSTASPEIRQRTAVAQTCRLLDLLGIHLNSDSVTKLHSLTESTLQKILQKFIDGKHTINAQSEEEIQRQQASLLLTALLQQPTSSDIGSHLWKIGSTSRIRVFQSSFLPALFAPRPIQSREISPAVEQSNPNNETTGATLARINEGQQSTAKTPPPSGNGAPSLMQQIRDLAANAPRLLEDKDIEAIWKKRDESGLNGASLLNDPCCQVFKLEGETTITDSPCSFKDLLGVVKNHSQAQDIINKFTRRELLVAVINTNKSSDGNKLGDLLREPLVFNWLYGLINDHASPEAKIQEEVHQQGEQEKTSNSTTIPTDNDIALMDMVRQYIGISPETRAANNPQVTIDAFEYFVNNNPDAQAFADVIQTPQDIVEFLELVFASASNNTVQIALKEEGNLKKLLDALKAKNTKITSNSSNDTSPASTVESNAANTAESSSGSTKHRGKESLGERFGTEISAAVTLLKEIFPDIQLTSQIFDQIVSRISDKPSTPPAVLLKCAQQLNIEFPDGRSTKKKPVLTEKQLNQVLNSTGKEVETHNDTGTNPNGQQVSTNHIDPIEDTTKQANSTNNQTTQVAQTSNPASPQNDIEPPANSTKLETTLAQMFTAGFQQLQTSLSTAVEGLRSNILQLAKTNIAPETTSSLEEKLTNMLDTGLKGIQETVATIKKTQDSLGTAFENLEAKVSQFTQRNETSTPVTTITNGETKPPKNQSKRKTTKALHKREQTPEENLKEVKLMLGRLEKLEQEISETRIKIGKK